VVIVGAMVDVGIGDELESAGGISVFHVVATSGLSSESSCRLPTSSACG